MKNLNKYLVARGWVPGEIMSEKTKEYFYKFLRFAVNKRIVVRKSVANPNEFIIVDAIMKYDYVEFRDEKGNSIGIPVRDIYFFHDKKEKISGVFIYGMGAIF